MITKAIEKILELADVSKGIAQIGGRVYSNEDLTPIKDPSCKPLDLHTLTGFVDWVKNKDEPNASIIHIRDEKSIFAYSDIHKEWRDREAFVHCTPFPVTPFSTGAYMSIEQFIIELQTKFIHTPVLQNLIQSVSHISGELVVTAEDDGSRQTVTVKDAIGRLADENIDPVLNLTPHRTFTEIAQPYSRYLLRLEKIKGGLPRVALYDAGNMSWRNEAIASIKKYLEDADLGVPIIA